MLLTVDYILEHSAWLFPLQAASWIKHHNDTESNWTQTTDDFLNYNERRKRNSSAFTVTNYSRWKGLAEDGVWHYNPDVEFNQRSNYFYQWRVNLSENPALDPDACSLLTLDMEDTAATSQNMELSSATPPSIFVSVNIALEI